MKITKIHYFETFELFQGHTRYKKVGFEMEIDDSFEDVKAACYKLQKQAEDFFYESKGAAEKQMGTQVVIAEQKNPISKVDALIADINSCADLKILESYQLIVKNNPLLQEAYLNKLKSLT